MVALMGKKRPKKEPTRFGVNLRKARESAGLTMAELGAVVGMQMQAIARLETSPVANPTIETLIKLATALNIPPAELLPIPLDPGEPTT